MSELDALVTEALRVPASLDALLPALPLTAVPGLSVGVAVGSVKAPGRSQPDVLVISADGPASFAAITTTSTAAAASCLWTRARVPGIRRAVAVNSGNANAATGRRGEADNREMAAIVARSLGCEVDDVLVCSTGVIGVPLPMERLGPALTVAAQAAAEKRPPASDPARAICTTDTRTKVAGLQTRGLTIAGIAKGAGMIHPNMATMLGYLATDAAVRPDDLQALLEAAGAATFNQISIDGDMSTNDTVVLIATGAGPTVEPGTAMWETLVAGVSQVARQLARDIARDGEGAHTLLSVAVRGGPDDRAARAWARAVVSSSLVKAAVHGKDPNWGRIVGALGAAGAQGLDQLSVDLGDVAVMRQGAPVVFDESIASAAMGQAELRVEVSLPGPGRGEAWGCDLSAEYVSINADYRS